MIGPQLPAITIVVPSYNQVDFLAETLDSLLGQDYPRLEVLVFDGGSTDGSVEILRERASSLAYWQSRPDGGQSAAIRAGFDRASGDVLGWTNSDDTLEPGALLAVGRHFALNPDCEWLYGNSQRIDERSHLLHRRYTVAVTLEELGRLSIYLPQESTFFSRKLYMRAGGIDPGLNMALDYDLWLKFSAISRPHHVDAFLGNFRMVAGQKSSLPGQYHAEELLVKQRLGFEPLAGRQRMAALARYRARTLRAYIRGEGWKAPHGLVRNQVSVLLGRSPQLGPSRVVAIGSLTLVGAVVVLGVMALVRALRRG